LIRGARVEAATLLRLDPKHLSPAIGPLLGLVAASAGGVAFGAD
jgi:hypothetical protein